MAMTETERTFLHQIRLHADAAMAVNVEEIANAEPSAALHLLAHLGDQIFLNGFRSGLMVAVADIAGARRLIALIEGVTRSVDVGNGFETDDTAAIDNFLRIVR